MAKSTAHRFGIGEWYGRSFVGLTPAERRSYAGQALSKSTKDAPPCPFMGDGTTPCPKRGGVCSLRLYQLTDPASGRAAPVAGDEGDLRTLCPHRFKQDGVIYAEIGQKLLGTSTPLIVSEVRFLQRHSVTDEGTDSEDVGNIDNVLVAPDCKTRNPVDMPLRWCALEIQAVYFSGIEMSALFRFIQDYPGRGMPFPDATRRPDYRSSGPKRLMPQLQIKVPTLRRWGKKMAVVVDAAWFRNNVIDVDTVDDLSNCDIAWFIVSFDESVDPARIVVSEPEKQTLERAVEGLTGGHPVALSAFESKIREKLSL